MSSKHSAGGGCKQRDGQLAEPAAEVKPDGQAVQFRAPAPEKVRTAQLLQVELLIAPTAEENFPARHFTMPEPSVLTAPTAPPPGQ